MSEPPDQQFKGFGRPAEPAKPAAPKRRRQPRLPDEEYRARRKYEQAEKEGQPTFEVFVRETGKSEWKAAGAIATSSNTIVQAVWSEEPKLRASAVRQYASLRKATEPLEYGYRRKEFPDDPILTANRPKPTIISQFRQFLSSKFTKPRK